MGGEGVVVELIGWGVATLAIFLLVCITVATVVTDNRHNKAFTQAAHGEHINDQRLLDVNPEEEDLTWLLPLFMIFVVLGTICAFIGFLIRIIP